jgi:hypothetical protein
MVVEFSFASTVAKFFLGKAKETNVENSVHVVQAITLLHSVMTDLYDSTEPDVRMFTDVKADLRPYMPQPKGNNATYRRAVFARNKFCTFFKFCPLVLT